MRGPTRCGRTLTADKMITRPAPLLRAQSAYAAPARPPLALFRAASAPATLYTRSDAADASLLASTLRGLSEASHLSRDERFVLKARLIDQHSDPTGGAAMRRSRAWTVAAVDEAAHAGEETVSEAGELDDADEIEAELDALRAIFSSDELDIAGTRRIKLTAVTHAYSEKEQLNARRWMTAKACRDFGASSGALERLLLGTSSHSSRRQPAEEPVNEVQLSIVLTARYPHVAPLVQVEGRGFCRFTVSAHGLAAAIEAKAAQLVGGPMLFDLLCLAQDHVAAVSETMAGGRGEAVIEVIQTPWGECCGTQGMATLYEAWETPYRAQIAALRSALDASTTSFGGTLLCASPSLSASASANLLSPTPQPPGPSATRQHVGKRTARKQARGVSLPEARHQLLAAVPPSLLEPQALVGSLHDLFDRIPECVLRVESSVLSTRLQYCFCVLRVEWTDRRSAHMLPSQPHTMLLFSTRPHCLQHQVPRRRLCRTRRRAGPRRAFYCAARHAL